MEKINRRSDRFPIAQASAARLGPHSGGFAEENESALRFDKREVVKIQIQRKDNLVEYRKGGHYGHD